MNYKTLQLDKDRRGIARLWLNRPDKHHAMNAQMISELHQSVSYTHLTLPTTPYV